MSFRSDAETTMDIHAPDLGASNIDDVGELNSVTIVIERF
jgi:hypothetical protein